MNKTGKTGESVDYENELWSVNPQEQVDFRASVARLQAEEAACRHQLASCSDAGRRALLLNRLGQLLYGQVRFDEASAAYTEALSEDPHLAAAAHNRATISYRMGYLAEAERDLLAAQRLQPDNVEVATGLAEVRRLLVAGGSAGRRDRSARGPVAVED
ncbi:uncharacterized protein LOC119114074 [Pollicipes pollicipes]|uniref:uncharacterized protein LOC119114074 n=1 Tax=Pollicipes pollicipes TaxID=41117 RepID=UPI001884DCAB|nr:uncharacterized protein LOC119114074 [Pollicipes pollicipes]